MTSELAQAALTFLARTDIKGAEADVFMQVCIAIRDLGKEAARDQMINHLSNEAKS